MCEGIRGLLETNAADKCNGATEEAKREGVIFRQRQTDRCRVIRQVGDYILLTLIW